MFSLKNTKHQQHNGVEYSHFKNYQIKKNE